MTKDKVICKYCKNTFKTKSSLNSHQKRAKYCLKLRNTVKEVLNICEGCKKSYSCKQNLNNHHLKCVEFVENKYKEIIENLKKEMKELKRKNHINIIDMRIEHKNELRELKNDLKDIAMESAKRPTNITNNNNRINQTINNLIPITDDYFREQAQYLTLDHIKEGVEGYAKYALEYPLKNRIVCVDMSRRKLKYKNDDGEVVIDQEMTKLSKKLFGAIEGRNTQLIQSYVNELKNTLYNNENHDMTEAETEEFTEQSNEIIKVIMEVTAKRREVVEAASGKRPDMYNDFLRNVCTLAS